MRTDPLLLIYSFQFRSAFRATTTSSQPRPLDTVACADHAETTPSQPQIRRPLPSPTPSVTVTCGLNSSIDALAWLGLSVWSEVHMICIAYGAAVAAATPIISCFIKIQISVTFLVPA